MRIIEIMKRMKMNMRILTFSDPHEAQYFFDAKYS